MNEFPMRLQCFIAKSTTLSRRKAEQAIADGRVEVNGTPVVSQGTKVGASDHVFLDGDEIFLHKMIAVYMLNKPRGYVCSDSDPHQKNFARDLITTKDHDMLFSIGRLDRDSSGLLLFTSDGKLAERISHPSHGIKKTYIVAVREKLDVQHLAEMKKGILLADSDIPYRITTFTQITSHNAEIILSSGKNREIRKLFEHFGYTVDSLVRVKIGSLELGDLKEGKFRKLSQQEIDSIFI